jgi:hypothetical protein
MKAFTKQQKKQKKQLKKTEKKAQKEAKKRAASQGQGGLISKAGDAAEMGHPVL